MKIINTNNILVVEKRKDPTYPGTHPYIVEADCDYCAEDLIVFMTKKDIRIFFNCPKCNSRNRMLLKIEDIFTF